MPGVMIGLGPCYLHGGLFEFDPDTVVTVLVDPQTGRPPDVGESGEPCTVDPAAEARAVQRPICDPCVETKVNPALRDAGRPGWKLARDREGGWPDAR
jgi:hypothetical protein